MRKARRTPVEAACRANFMSFHQAGSCALWVSTFYIGASSHADHQNPCCLQQCRDLLQAETCLCEAFVFMCCREAYGLHDETVMYGGRRRRGPHITHMTADDLVTCLYLQY